MVMALLFSSGMPSAGIEFMEHLATALLRLNSKALFTTNPKYPQFLLSFKEEPNTPALWKFL